MKHLERVVYNCIEFAEQNDLGMFIFNNQKGCGFVHNLPLYLFLSIRLPVNTSEVGVFARPISFNDLGLMY